MTGIDFVVGQRILVNKRFGLSEMVVVEKSRRAVLVEYPHGGRNWYTTTDYGDTWQWELVEVLPSAVP